MADNLTPPPSPPSSSSPLGDRSLPVKSYKGFAVSSWILIILTCLISLVPVIGFATWVLAFVVIPLTLVFAIIILTRGGKAQGITLLITSVVLLPAFLLVAPLASTLILGAVVSPKNKTQESSSVSPAPESSATAEPSASPEGNE